ncbi:MULTISPECIES: hypothetical protein [Burkholderia]|uniref:hypothetical protein n=1 Tax=Burkholderia TaxID=32008 RepID=UPI0011AF7CFD|nr:MULTISPECIES: hypothetical protein [unclassified Burkholderia]
MPTTTNTTAMPCPAFAPSAPPLPSPAAAPARMMKRSESLPARISADHLPARRPIGLARPYGRFVSPRNLANDVANSFLKNAGFDLALRENKLIVTRHRDLEAAEAQYPPSGQVLAQVCQAWMTMEPTPAKLDIAAALLPVINAQLLEHIEDCKMEGSLKESVKELAKKYLTAFGGRDLAIDDLISTVNTYFFDKIGTNNTLTNANIASAALTALFMLVPTIGKNLPILMAAVRDKRYKDAILPALSIMSITAMTLNPTMAALGRDLSSAIAGSAGNLLMMTHLPEILHHGYEWAQLKNTRFPAETHPFTHFARNHGLVDQGLHAALDFMHEFGAQSGFLALNMVNAVTNGGSARNPAVFPLLAMLLGSFVLHTTRGEPPFSEFKADRNAIAEGLTANSEHHSARARAAMLFLQQKIAATYDANFGSIIAPQLNRSFADAHIARQLGGHTLSDEDEKTFVKNLLSHFVNEKKAKDAIQVAIDKIYRYEDFDPATNACGDPQLAEILRFVQAQRNKDRAFLRNTRGFAHSNHVYRNIISHAIQCAVFEELGR